MRIVTTIGIAVKRARKTDVKDADLPVADVIVIALAEIAAFAVGTLSIDITRIYCKFIAFVDIYTVNLARCDVELLFEAESAWTSVAAKSVVADFSDGIAIVFWWRNIFAFVVVLASYTTIGMNNCLETIVTAAFKPRTIITRAAILLC